MASVQKQSAPGERLANYNIRNQKMGSGQHSQNSEKSSLCRKNTVAYDREGDIISDGQHPPIVSYDTFCMAQKQLQEKSIPQVHVGTELKTTIMGFYSVRTVDIKCNADQRKTETVI